MLRRRCPGATARLGPPARDRETQAGGMILDLALAFVAGLLSFASTCVLPLVPAYIAYMGAAATDQPSTIRRQLGVLGNAALFAAGLGLPFLLAAGLSGILTRLLARVRGAYSVLNAVAAVFLIAMGLLILTNRPTLFNEYLPVLAPPTPFQPP